MSFFSMSNSLATQTFVHVTKIHFYMTFDNNTFFKLATGGVYTCVYTIVYWYKYYTGYTELLMYCGIVCATNLYKPHNIYLHLHDISS